MRKINRAEFRSNNWLLKKIIEAVLKNNIFTIVLIILLKYRSLKYRNFKLSFFIRILALKKIIDK